MYTELCRIIQAQKQRQEQKIKKYATVRSKRRTLTSQENGNRIFLCDSVRRPCAGGGIRRIGRCGIRACAAAIAAAIARCGSAAKRAAKEALGSHVPLRGNRNGVVRRRLRVAHSNGSSRKY